MANIDEPRTASGYSSTYRRTHDLNANSGLLGHAVEKTLTFDGGTTNGVGDFDGTGNPATLFTITGSVLIQVVGICLTDLAGATATVEVGVTGATAAILAQETATDIDANKIWHDATVDATIEASSVISTFIASTNIILTAATANVSGGSIKFIARWVPLSADGNVVAA